MEKNQCIVFALDKNPWFLAKPIAQNLNFHEISHRFRTNYC